METPKVISIKLTKRLHDHLVWEIVRLNVNVYNQSYVSYWKIVTEKEADTFFKNTQAISFIEKIKNSSILTGDKIVKVKEVKCEDCKIEKKPIKKKKKKKGKRKEKERKKIRKEN